MIFSSQSTLINLVSWNSTKHSIISAGKDYFLPHLSSLVTGNHVPVRLYGRCSLKKEKPQWLLLEFSDILGATKLIPSCSLTFSVISCRSFTVILLNWTSGIEVRRKSITMYCIRNLYLWWSHQFWGSRMNNFTFSELLGQWGHITIR
jgi:hypothetical protein